MRIVIRESERKAGSSEGSFQDAVVYRLGQEEGVQLTLLNEGDHVTVRIESGVDGSAPAKGNHGASASRASGSRRYGHVRRVRIARH